MPARQAAIGICPFHIPGGQMPPTKRGAPKDAPISALGRHSVEAGASYIMSIPPMPPMPPGIAGASFFGSSAIIASVVMRSEATEAAF